MTDNVHEADFSRGPKRRPDEGRRRLYLKGGVARLSLEPKDFSEPVRRAIASDAVFRLLRDELRTVPPEDFDELVVELGEAAVERHDAMEALSPTARNIAVNQGRRERQELRERQASQEPGAA